MLQAISTEHLAQFLNALSLQRQTGILRIEQVGERQSEQGEIHFENGHIIHAHAGREKGNPALRRISNWEHVVYTFSRNRKPPPHNLFTQAGPKNSQAPQGASRPASPSTTPLGRAPQGAGRPASPSTTPLGQVPHTPLQAGVWQAKRTTRLLSPQSGESFPGSETAQERPVQAFPTQREAASDYPPGHPARGNRGEQTRQPVQGQQLPGLPITPRPHAWSEEEHLPSRLAIFRARAMITTNRAIQAMGRRERVIFILLDSRRTVQDIARLTHHSEREVAQIMVYLTKHGYTEYLSG